MPAARTTTDADYFHHVLEAWKVRDQVRRVADPERWPVDFAEHLTLEHAKKLFEKIDPKKASSLERPQPDDARRAARRGSAPGRRRLPWPMRRQHDRGDADAEHVGRHVLRLEGARLPLQQPPALVAHHARRYGSLVPLMRSSTASVPTLVFEKTASGDVPKLAVGCAGNAWIPVSVYNIILAVIDGNLGAQAAIEAPRFLPSAIRPIRSTTARDRDRGPAFRARCCRTSRRGHRFQKIGRKGEVRYGYAAAVLVDAANRRVEGGAEPRRSHAAVPFEGARTTQ